MTLLNRGCQRAVRTGVERLTAELLDTVKCDAASEAARRELEAALASGRLTIKAQEAQGAKPSKPAVNLTGKEKQTNGTTGTASRTAT